MKVTIGIPVFNCQAWIRHAIESSLNQTWPDKEVIVVDDGSSDDTHQICQSFGNRIRYIRQNNRGVCAARNRILYEATGDWIQYLDADDYLMPRKVEAQLNSIAGSKDVDVSAGSYVIETWRDGNVIHRGSHIISRAGTKHRHGKPLGRPIQKHHPAEQDYSLMNSSYLLEIWIVNGPSQIAGYLWKTDVLHRLGGWDESLRVGEDAELYLRAFQANLHFDIFDEPLAVWRRCWSDSSLSLSNFNQMFLVYGDLLDRCETWLKSGHRWTKALQDLLRRRRFCVAREIAKTDIELAVNYYEKQRLKGSMGTDGSMAPWKYQVALRALGFKRTEQLASSLRSVRQRRVRHLLHSMMRASTMVSILFMLAVLGSPTR
jgi:glycosyltransferase involved in cell wall biosynthesis